MAIRFPLFTAGTFTSDDELGAGSVAGGVPYEFNLPQDVDNVVVKLTASVEGAYSAVLQTTDDGGSTWYDVARTSIVSNANGTTAEWLSVPVNGYGVRTTALSSVVAAGSTITVGSDNTPIGSAAASSLGSKQYSGLPILSTRGRVVLRLTGNIANVAYNNAVIEVMTNSQSPNP